MLFDVECYRDLEMWARGHSKSLKTVPCESLGTDRRTDGRTDTYNCCINIARQCGDCDVPRLDVIGYC